MEIIESIRGFISTEICSGSVQKIDDADLLIENGIIDSVGIMLLLGFIEEKFAITIDGDELIPENFSTIATISTLVGKKIG
ncbi:acyl carrier protein [Desulfuromonas sp. CSMB_57]|uniref:acyl carrier protein n=1 Tax=Desulfuromonas sp. CSMB_57 TaxID=2807629 RepID=UPI001CD6885F|nr:acyl carrier protein [Desulfuromonas sp. CSMB_57]